jgi:hypothetical protein
MPRGHGPKDWRPYSAAHDPEKIAADLRRLAPSFVYDVQWDRDENAEWDGDPEADPRDQGFMAYDVEFTLSYILRGQMITERTYLGGVWEDPDKIDPDVAGYLPQKLLEVTEEALDHKLEISDALKAELEEARKYLKEVLRIRYNAEQRGRGGG